MDSILYLYGIIMCHAERAALGRERVEQQPGEGESEMNVTTIGLDIAKNVFQAHGGAKTARW